MAAPVSSSVVYRSPLGPLKLTATEEGVEGVKYLFGKHAHTEASELKDQGEVEDGGKSWSEDLLDDSEASSHLKTCCEWLDSYFTGTLLREDPPPPPRPKVVFPKKGLYGVMK